MSGTLATRAGRSTFNLFVNVMIAGMIVAIATGIGLAIWNSYSSNRYDTLQDQRHSALSANTTSSISMLNMDVDDLNTTLCAKITMVNDTVNMNVGRIEMLEIELNITGSSGMTFQQNVTVRI